MEDLDFSWGEVSDRRSHYAVNLPTFVGVVLFGDRCTDPRGRSRDNLTEPRLRAREHSSHIFSRMRREPSDVEFLELLTAF